MMQSYDLDFKDPILSIPCAVTEQSWALSRSASDQIGQWNYYLNHLCLSIFQPWLQDESGLDVQVLSTAQPLASLWNFVGGVPLQFGNKRLLVLPYEELELEELAVPQEWVDIPELIADYYLAVQVNLDDGWIGVRGYATHRELKEQGNFSWSERTYRLPENSLCDELNVLFLSMEFCPQEKTRVDITALPSVESSQAEHLLQRLGNPDILRPRLELPFELWGSLLPQSDWREHLRKLRQGGLQSDATTKVARVQLSQWFQGIVSEGWMSLQNLGNLRPQVSLRTSTQRETADNTELVQRAKVLPFKNSPQLTLVVNLKKKEDMVSVQVQLHPSENSELSEHIMITLLDDSGRSLQTVQSRSCDDYIQLKRFTCPLNTSFQVEIEARNEILREQFIV